MTTSAELSKHFYHIHFGGNWTLTNFKETLSDVTYEEATRSVQGLNSILRLTNHTSYFLPVLKRVLEGGPLIGKDEESFDYCPVHSEEDWQNLLSDYWRNAELITDLIKKLPDEQLFKPFYDGKYGNYFRNINGVIEHSHYHLGQIALIKKMIRS